MLGILGMIFSGATVLGSVKKIAWAVPLFIVPALFMAYLGWTQWRFHSQVDGRVRWAANALTIEGAQLHLRHTINYLKRNGLTEGDTDLFWSDPDNDIGAFFERLVEAEGTLEHIRLRDRLTERHAILARVHQILMDNGDAGEYVKRPKWMAFYPHVVRDFLVGIAIAAGWIMCLMWKME